jgi:pimeloyl-ACP methyl ester carboxylesterase
LNPSAVASNVRVRLFGAGPGLLRGTRIRAKALRALSLPWRRRAALPGGVPPAGVGRSYFCVKAFSETDFNEDLKKIDVPTLILHGDDDQIVPIGVSALRTSKIVKGATLKVYPGLPHGMCSTHKDQINADLSAPGGRQARTSRVILR